MHLLQQQRSSREASIPAATVARSFHTGSTESEAGPSTGSAPAEYSQASHAAPAAQYAAGWYYQDILGYTQGPFTKQQLVVWRQHLPMDLLVWFIDQNGGSSHGLDLAKVLGDVRLLQAWRQANGKDVSVPSILQSCTDAHCFCIHSCLLLMLYVHTGSQNLVHSCLGLGSHSVVATWTNLCCYADEHDVMRRISLGSSAQNTTRSSAPAATAYELQAAKAAKPGSDWADAALAGLPPEDEAVQMAELAATAGRSLEVQVVLSGMSLVLFHVVGCAGSLHLRYEQGK